MHTGNRLFPYPVLNQDATLSGYVKSSTFNLNFDVADNRALFAENGTIIFKNLHFILTDPLLNDLLAQGKVKGAFIVECSSSMYRKKFDITTIPYDLKINDDLLNGNVSVACYLYATEDIPSFKSDSFIPDYADYSFDIDKFDILAVDDAFQFKINRETTEDDKVSSIFEIIRTERNDDTLTYDNEDTKIIIYLPEKYYSSYDNIKTRHECNNIAFAMLAIPVLASCLNEVWPESEEEITFEDILDSHSWFDAILKSYKKATGKDLAIEDFESINSKLDLAQIVLNNATCTGLKDFDNMLLGSLDDQEDSDE